MIVKKVLSLTLASVLILSIWSSCPAQSLRDYADKLGILIGTAVNPRLFTEEAYASTLARELQIPARLAGPASCASGNRDKC